ncbi:hypothetical protein [Streptomyces syringium]|uniref:hypothetical protein n=1 Tax=Streptomyces syringium TaxID=76729 RepID=UPI003432E2A4
MGTKWSAAPWGVGLALVGVMASAAAPAVAHGQASHQLAKRIVLTNPDTGRSVPASTGDDIEVRLTHYSERGLNYSWDIPQSSDPAVLRRTSGGSTPAGDATVTFRGEKVGTVTLSAARRCRPDPGRICPLATSPWRVTVTVN